VIAVAAHKNQCQRIGLGNIALEENGFVVTAIGAVGLLRSRQGGVV